MLVVNPDRSSAVASVTPFASTDAVSISERRVRYLLQINGAPVGSEFDQFLHAAGLGGNGGSGSGSTLVSADLCLLWNGPQMWFAQSDSDQAVARLGDTLSRTAATITDVSHGRTIFRLTGRDASTLISKGCPVDIGAMSDASVVSSHIGHLNVMVHKIDAQTFDLFVFRSFGQALYEWLADAAVSLKS